MKKGLFRFSVCFVMAFILVASTSMLKVLAAPAGFYTSNGTVDTTKLENSTTGKYVGVSSKYFSTIFKGYDIPDELDKKLVINELNGTSMVITKESGLNIGFWDFVLDPFGTLVKIYNYIFSDPNVNSVEYKTVEEFLTAFGITDVA